MRVLITRPEADARALAEAVAARGHAPLIEPLLIVEPLGGDTAPPDGTQAILLSSAHAVPALDEAARSLPLYAVGAATAAAARAAGCRAVVVAGGDATRLARLVVAERDPAAGALFHPSGADVRTGLADALAAAGFDYRRRAVYRARAADHLSPAAAAALGAGQVGAVLLFSPRTAKTFTRLIVSHELCRPLASAGAICLSAAVAAACTELPWRAVRVAARPEGGAILEQLDALGRRW